jgi:hypothetical protein
MVGKSSHGWQYFEEDVEVPAHGQSDSLLVSDFVAVDAEEKQHGV